MKIALLAAMFVLCSTNAVGQGKVLANDPLTSLALIPATDPGNHTPNLA